LADNLTVTPGTGLTIAADDIGGALHQRIKVSVGPDGTATDWIGSVGGYTDVPSDSFTRPSDTNAYAIGDLVANSTTAGSVVPMDFTIARVSGGSGMIRRARIRKSTATLTNAQFWLHIFSTVPTMTNGDNGAFLATISGYLGAFYVSMDRDFSDGAFGSAAPLVGADIGFKLASGQVVYGLLEARAAYAPGNAEVFTVELEVYQD
jgi:hypothetical protein